MGVYNSISNVRRIAFIDGLTDENAKILSVKYPFAICYASLPSENENDNIKWMPGFWKAGERYGIQNVDENPVTLNGFTINLSLDKTTGTLKLISNESSIPVTTISINPSSIQLNVGEVYPLSVSFIPSNTTDKSITWASSDSSKVIVANSGVVRAQASTNPGEEVIIQATSNSDSTIYGTCRVTVNNAMTEFYYYAGWTLPASSNIDSIIVETYHADYEASNSNTAGKKTTSKSSMNYLTNTLYNPNEKTYYYVLVPTGHSIYDSLNNDISNSAFRSQGNITIGNQMHTIYKSTVTSRYINAIEIREIIQI